MIELMFGIALAVADGAMGMPMVVVDAVDAWDLTRPARLVITDRDDRAIQRHYPTRADCERAREVELRRMDEERSSAAQRAARTGSRGWRWVVEPTCFPSAP